MNITDQDLDHAIAVDNIPGVDAFEIDRSKLEEVTRILNQETDPKATEELVESEICGDWHERDHQDWINAASAQEIADWLASFYQ